MVIVAKTGAWRHLAKPGQIFRKQLITLKGNRSRGKRIKNSLQHARRPRATLPVIDVVVVEEHLFVPRAVEGALPLSSPRRGGDRLSRGRGGLGLPPAVASRLSKSDIFRSASGAGASLMLPCSVLLRGRLHRGLHGSGGGG